LGGGALNLRPARGSPGKASGRFFACWLMPGVAYHSGSGGFAEPMHPVCRFGKKLGCSTAGRWPVEVRGVWGTEVDRFPSRGATKAESAFAHDSPHNASCNPGPLRLQPPSFELYPRTTRDLRRRTEIMPVKGSHTRIKTVGFGQRPRPLHNRYTRTDTCVRWVMAVT
jgi:hypothetical protein